MLVDGLDIEIQSEEGEIYEKVWLFDFDNPENNDFLVVKQFTVIEKASKEGWMSFCLLTDFRC